MLIFYLNMLPITLSDKNFNYPILTDNLLSLCSVSLTQAINFLFPFIKGLPLLYERTHTFGFYLYKQFHDIWLDQIIEGISACGFWYLLMQNISLYYIVKPSMTQCTFNRWKGELIKKIFNVTENSLIIAPYYTRVFIDPQSLGFISLGFIFKYYQMIFTQYYNVWFKS